MPPAPAQSGSIDTPAASIIIATYNRPQVLNYAIRSVLQSTFTDWELIVVGDGCTDDTEDVVRSFADPRISWHNLPTNSGNQAAPNNAGVALARGRYLLFLNHDDLWFGDHLAKSIDLLERSGADIIFSPVALLTQSGRDSGPPDPEVDRMVLDGVSPDGYDPRAFVIASSWAMRHEAAVRVGLWRQPTSTRLSPSQEWLFRADRIGLRILYDPHVSVLCIHAGTRGLSYLRPSPDHDRAWTWVRDRARPDADLLEAIAVHTAAEVAALRRQIKPDGVGKRLRGLAVRAAEKLGVHPHTAERLLAGMSKGEWIAHVHSVTFDAPDLSAGTTIKLAEPTSRKYLMSGWHDSEDWGAWSATDAALIGFVVPVDTVAPILEIKGGPLSVPSVVTFRVDGQADQHIEFRSQHDTARVILGEVGKGPVFLTVAVDQVVAPLRLGLGKDPRPLGFALESLRLVPAGEPH